MKAFKIAMAIILGCNVLMACEPGTVNPEPTPEAPTLNEQAHIVATALSNNQGGVGQDIDNIVRPEARTAARAVAVSLSISAVMDYYDAEDNLQEAYDPDTTDRIDYESEILGNLSNSNGFFQELSIDNRSDFMATELLSRTAIIDGTHNNHSSYTRIQMLNQAQIHFNLECDLSAVGVAVDLDADDTFPEAGTIEGTVSGSYERVTTYTRETRELYFHFIAVYLGDNSAEIELNDGTIFIVRLDTGEIEDLVVP